MTTLNLKLSKSERERMDAAAAAARLSLSDFLRRAVEATFTGAVARTLAPVARTERVVFRLPEDLAARIKTAARRSRLSVAEYIRASASAAAREPERLLTTAAECPLFRADVPDSDLSVSLASAGIASTGSNKWETVADGLRYRIEKDGDNVNVSAESESRNASASVGFFFMRVIKPESDFLAALAANGIASVIPDGFRAFHHADALGFRVFPGGGLGTFTRGSKIEIPDYSRAYGKHVGVHGLSFNYRQGSKLPAHVSCYRTGKPAFDRRLSVPGFLACDSESVAEWGAELV